MLICIMLCYYYHHPSSFYVDGNIYEFSLILDNWRYISMAELNYELGYQDENTINLR